MTQLVDIEIYELLLARLRNDWPGEMIDVVEDTWSKALRPRPGHALDAELAVLTLEALKSQERWATRRPTTAAFLAEYSYLERKLTPPAAEPVETLASPEAIATMVAEARAVLGQEPIPAQAPDPLAEARRVLAELTSVIDRADRARQDLLAVIELAVEPQGSLL